MLWGDSGSRRCLCYCLGGGHCSAGDALREIAFGDTEEWGLRVRCWWCKGVFYVYWAVPDSDV